MQMGACGDEALLLLVLHMMRGKLVSERQLLDTGRL